ncbi:MAG: hypothetical protein R3C52_05420 [Hyphomonadaceae bacterium]
METGGVENPVSPPEMTVPCEQAGLKLVDVSFVRMPDEIGLFFAASQTFQWESDLVLAYDVGPNGKPGNIRYVGPPENLEHGTRRKLVRYAADKLKGYTFGWPGEPAYAVDCQGGYRVIVDWVRDTTGSGAMIDRSTER